MTDSPSDHPDDANRLRAFRYLSGEMSDEEGQEFEASLEDDASLQRTLVEMVRLTDLIVEADPPELVRPNGIARRFWFALASVAALLFLGILVWPDPGPDSAVVDVSPDSATETTVVDAVADDIVTPSDLVVAWSRSSLTVDSDLASDTPEELATLDEADSEDDVVSIPEWMLAAVQLDASPESEAMPVPESELDEI